jgi:hypothetical protein
MLNVNTNDQIAKKAPGGKWKAERRKRKAEGRKKKAEG